MNSEFCNLFPINTQYLVHKNNIVFSGIVVGCDPFENTVEIQITTSSHETIIDNNGDTIDIGDIGIFDPKVWKFQKIDRYISTKRSTHSLTARSARGKSKKKRNKKSKRRRL